MKTILIYLLVILTSAAYAQTTITGKVLSADGQPLPFASVLLLQATDSSLVTGTVTETDGRYELTARAAGEYILSSQMLGHQTRYRPMIIPPSSAAISQPDFLLETDAALLNEVTVKARRPLFEHKIDRLVVNVAQSVTSTGGNALEVLTRSPGVRVDGINNQLSLDGATGVMVQVNGKQTRLGGDALLQLLRSLPAASIEKIELISTPPASYDAEGVGGIINIVLVQKLDEGLNGNFGLNAGYGQRPKFGSSLDLNLRKGKVNLFTNLSFSNDYLQEDVTITKAIRTDLGTLATDTYSNRPAFRGSYRGNLGMDYELTDKTTLGVLLSGYTSRWHLDATTNTTISLDGNLDERSVLSSEERNDWVHYLGNVNLRHNFGNDWKLALDYDYLNYFNNNPANYVDRTQRGQWEPTRERVFISRKENPITFHVAKADVTKKISDGWNLEFGAKVSVSDLANDNLVADLEGGNRLINQDYTNLIEMDERISATYLSTDYQISEKTSAKAGLRYEHTDISLMSAAEILTTRNYGRVFPSLFLAHNFNDNNSFQLAYSERIQRPSLNVLAPAFFFFSPNVLTTGNPTIRESINKNMRASLRHKSVMLTLIYGRELLPVFWGQLDVVPEENLTVTRPENMRDGSRLIAFLGFPVKMAKWWESRYELGIIRTQQSPIFEDEVFSRANTFGGINFNHSFIVKEGLRIEVDGNYRTSSAFGLATNPAVGTFNVGTRKQFANGNSVSLSWQDAFNLGSFFGAEFNSPELNLVYKQIYQQEGSVVRLSYSHNFGNKKMKGKEHRNSASSDERNRVQ